ncbi:MAG: hypothetical protein MR300_00415 [Ruminococcus sp.]|nr:hypothetical protein [Ruminococcus sp.]
MGKYIIINNNQYKLYIEFSYENFDYYTQIKMFLENNDKNFLIANENILFYYNLFNLYTKNIDNYILPNQLDPNFLGKQLNEYYYQIWTEKKNQNIILNEEGLWIGEKYCCFTYNDCATWIYKYNDELYLLITKLYNNFCNIDELNDFQLFIKNYNDFCKYNITIEELQYLKRYFKLLKNKIF